MGAGRRRAAEAISTTTVNTQPVMLTAGVAVWRAWQAAGGPMPAVLAGHSLGEYTALVAAGALAFRDAVPLVRFRAQAMQDAVPAGRGRDGRDPGRRRRRGRSAVCRRRRKARSSKPVNFNAPGADRDRRSQGSGRARDRRSPSRRAPSAACCCRCPRRSTARCCEPAAEQLARAARRESTFEAPAIPVLHNVDVARAPRRPTRSATALARQAASPVRWTETIAGVRRARRHARRRMRAGQGAGGLDKRIVRRARGVRARPTAPTSTPTQAALAG